jgi:hypothetical protein
MENVTIKIRTDFQILFRKGQYIEVESIMDLFTASKRVWYELTQIALFI